MSDSQSNSLSDIRRRKHDLRHDMQVRRAALQARNRYAPQALCNQFLNISIASGRIVSAYIATKSEMDPVPLIEALRKQGHTIALPVVTGKAVPLIFRSHNSGDALVTGGVMALLEPCYEAPLVEPDIVLVPMLAFDRRKYRLGYGGGYYDRTLALLRSRKEILAIGIGYAGQEVPSVPIGIYDVPLDKIITENQIIS